MDEQLPPPTERAAEHAMRRAPERRPPERARAPRMPAAVRWLRRAIVSAVLVGLVVAVVLALIPSPVAIEEARVTRGPLTAFVEGDGMTRVRHRYVVLAPLGGTMTRVLARAGDAVHEGDVLTTILAPQPPLLDVRTREEARARVAAAAASVREAQAMVQQARAARDLARTEAKRSELLASQGAAAAQEAERSAAEARSKEAALTSAEFAARAAEHDLAQARAALVQLETPGRQGGLEVTSPVEGRILKVARESEGTVAAGTPLLEVGDVRDLEVVVDVLTTEAVRIPPGARVEIDRWGGRDVLRGRVSRIEPSAFTKTSALGVDEQRVNVIIELTDPPERWEMLGDGFRVEARIIVWHGDDVLRMPIGAAFRHGDAWATYVVEGGRARLRAVKLGERGERDIQVLEGVRERDRVISYPSDAIRDGVRVQAVGG